MKPLKGDQQLRSVSLSYSVTLQALEPKSSPRRRRGLDASTDRGLTERSGEVFLLDILSHRMSDMASRVENRRSGVSLPVAIGMLSHDRLNPAWLDPVSCSRSSNRTGRFPASGSRKRHTMVRVTPSATSEHDPGWLDSSSIPMSFVASCVRL
jgi:hypothetical protein